MNTFATAITCIDGRVQEPVVDWVRRQFNVRYVDLITEPGPDKVLAEGDVDIIAGIVRRVLFSIEHHHSQLVVLSGHETCAANPVSREEHVEQILEGVHILTAYQLPARIVGLCVSEWDSIDLVWDASERGAARGVL